MQWEEKGRQSRQREAAAAQPQARERRSRLLQQLCDGITGQHHRGGYRGVGHHQQQQWQRTRERERSAYRPRFPWICGETEPNYRKEWKMAENCYQVLGLPETSLAVLSLLI